VIFGRASWLALVGLVGLVGLTVACGDQVTVLGSRQGGGLGDDDALLGQGGNALTEACRDCVSDVEEDDCDGAARRCRNDEACGLYLKCQKHCGWAKICDEACSSQFPEGKQAFEDLPECYVCEPCSSDCAEWWVHVEYCEASP